MVKELEVFGESHNLFLINFDRSQILVYNYFTWNEWLQLELFILFSKKVSKKAIIQYHLYQISNKEIILKIIFSGWKIYKGLCLGLKK